LGGRVFVFKNNAALENVPPEGEKAGRIFM